MEKDIEDFSWILGKFLEKAPFYPSLPSPFLISLWVCGLIGS